MLDFYLQNVRKYRNIKGRSRGGNPHRLYGIGGAIAMLHLSVRQFGGLPLTWRGRA